MSLWLNARSSVFVARASCLILRITISDTSSEGLTASQSWTSLSSITSTYALVWERITVQPIMAASPATLPSTSKYKERVQLNKPGSFHAFSIFGEKEGVWKELQWY